MMISGFLVVVKEVRGVSLLNPRYQGVDRIPAWPSDFEEENIALENYVFGDYKDPETNLIPTYLKARELIEALAHSRREFEVLHCCEATIEPSHSELQKQTDAVGLGFDVAAVDADNWSIVMDMPNSVWARPYSLLLNDQGLFPSCLDAQAYLNDYQSHKEADYDLSPLKVIFVARAVNEVEKRDEDKG